MSSATGGRTARIGKEQPFFAGDNLRKHELDGFDQVRFNRLLFQNSAKPNPSSKEIQGFSGTFPGTALKY